MAFFYYFVKVAVDSKGGFTS